MPAATTTTIKVPKELRDRAAGLAETGQSLAAVLAEALDKLEEDRFWAAAEQARIVLESSPELAERYDEFSSTWDAAVRSHATR